MTCVRVDSPALPFFCPDICGLRITRRGGRASAWPLSSGHLGLPPSTSPNSVSRTGLMPTKFRTLRRMPAIPWPRNQSRQKAAGIPIVTTIRAERPPRSVLVEPPPRSGYAKAVPGRMTCSRNAFSSAGIVPSQSGKMKTMCSAQTISSAAGARLSGTVPFWNSSIVRSIGKSIIARSIKRTVWPADFAPFTSSSAKTPACLNSGLRAASKVIAA